MDLFDAALMSAIGGGDGSGGSSVPLESGAGKNSVQTIESSAKGENSLAEGYKTTANAKYSHSEGRATNANGVQSHAEGKGTIASGEQSHAEGFQTTASAYSSHAEGSYTKASGAQSHAEGGNTEATGNCSHAEGYNTIAQGDYSHAEGYYNIASSDYLHVVGNGNSDTKRSNAHTLDSSGNAWFAGNVYVGSESGKNRDKGSKRLLTEDDLPSISGSGSGSSASTMTVKVVYDGSEGILDCMTPEVDSRDVARAIQSGVSVKYSLVNISADTGDGDEFETQRVSPVACIMKQNGETIDDDSAEGFVYFIAINGDVPTLFRHNETYMEEIKPLAN